MRAVVYDHYGPPDVLRIEEVARPTPKDDEVLIKIHAATVNRLDVHTREANRKSGLLVSALSRLVSGVRAPRQRILGSEFAGEVVEKGANVTDFKVGDRVFGNTGLRFGTHAEFTCVKQSARIANMPTNATFEQAAAITDGAFNALWCLRVGNVNEGQTILVYGASGAIGTAGVQLARYLGASVTAVCSTRNLALVKSLGADRVIDYTKEDFTKDGERYDAIFDAVGKNTFEHTKSSLKPGGVYLATDGFRNLLLHFWTQRFGDKKVRFQLPPVYAQKDLLLLKELVETRKFKPVIDRTYAMEEVIDAARYVETEQKTGNVVLKITV